MTANRTTGQPRRTRQRARPQRPRPLPPGDSLFTPGASATRQAIEHRSAAPLLMLRQMPTWILPALLVGLLATGLAVHRWIGAIALCAVAVILSWLAALSWPGLSGRGRLLRAAAIAFVLLAAVLRVVHI